MSQICPLLYVAHVLICIIMSTINLPVHGTLSSLAKNDPFPLFTSLDPHEFLLTQDKLFTKGFISERSYWCEHASLSISPFGQNANWGKTFCGDRFIGGQPVELGDIMGRWNMLALLFGDTPQGQTLPPILQTARNSIYPNVVGAIDDVSAIDPQQKFASFSIPLKYRKRGVRFDLVAQLCGDFGIHFQTGAADIIQCLVLSQTLNEPDQSVDFTAVPVPAGFIDLTPKATVNSNGTFGCSNVTTTQVECSLMGELRTIADEIGLNIGNFEEVSIEDVRLELYWRHAYPASRCAPNTAGVLIIPYFWLSGSLAAGKKQDVRCAFSLPFGNNQHHSIGFTAGTNFDFFETIEIGAEIGAVHFFAKDFCGVPIPTNEFQNGIYPFSTDVRIQPGFNWHFAAKIGAYHFLECLSFWFQYVMIEHQADKICLKQPDPAFKPDILAKKTKFNTKIANVGFNYDVTPHISLGFAWQAPLTQNNSYRSSTLLFSLSGIF